MLYFRMASTSHDLLAEWIYKRRVAYSTCGPLRDFANFFETAVRHLIVNVFHASSLFDKTVRMLSVEVMSNEAQFIVKVEEKRAIYFGEYSICTSEDAEK